jgi:hypothetical protein
VGPALVAQNLINEAPAHFELVGDRRHRNPLFVELPYSLDVSRSELLGLAPFPLGIRLVVLVRPKEKMERIAANAVIANMTDSLIFWDWPDERLVSESVKKHFPSRVIPTHSDLDSDVAIARRLGCGVPAPGSGVDRAASPHLALV